VLPHISGKQAVHVFAKAGWVLRNKGSHLVLTKPGSRYNLSVPNHREIKEGTLRSLICKAGLTVKEFIELLD